MTLKSEIETKSKQIRTDSYPMSIGELSNLYRDKELDVHPEFQRIYRWTEPQKTRLIESLLLGIPLPPIFVAQRTDGVWDVIDGVQRISTILQFMGLLRDDGGEIVDPLVLLSSKYLPSLEGKVWESRDKSRSFSKDEQLFIKRAKIDVNIVLKESDDDAKYELFMRLNTGGTALSAQEVRNCLLVMSKPETYKWLRSLSDMEPFLEAIGLSDRSIEEQYHMELVFRFLIFRTMQAPELTKVGDIGEFLNNQVSHITSLDSKQRRQEEAVFTETFEYLAKSLGSDGFRRYDCDKEAFTGGFSVSAYETIALAIGYHYDGRVQKVQNIMSKVKQLWKNSEFLDNSGSGVRASSRIQKVVPLGRKIFKP